MFFPPVSLQSTTKQCISTAYLPNLLDSLKSLRSMDLLYKWLLTERTSSGLIPDVPTEFYLHSSNPYWILTFDKCSS